MVRILSIVSVLSIVSLSDASQYYYAPLGPWGVDSSIINVGAIRRQGRDIEKVETVSRKDSKEPTDKVEEVKSELDDDLQKAEEAFFRAVEEVEEAVVHAIDDEVETFFPHHKSEE